MASEHDRAKALGRQQHGSLREEAAPLECTKRAARGALLRDVFVCWSDGVMGGRIFFII